MHTRTHACPHACTCARTQMHTCTRARRHADRHVRRHTTHRRPHTCSCMAGPSAAAACISWGRAASYSSGPVRLITSASSSEALLRMAQRAAPAGGRRQEVGRRLQRGGKLAASAGGNRRACVEAGAASIQVLGVSCCSAGSEEAIARAVGGAADPAGSAETPQPPPPCFSRLYARVASWLCSSVLNSSQRFPTCRPTGVVKSSPCRQRHGTRPARGLASVCACATAGGGWRRRIHDRKCTCMRIQGPDYTPDDPPDAAAGCSPGLEAPQAGQA